MLRQIGLVSEYLAKFRLYISRLQQADALLYVIFYNSLKDGVKDKIAREDQPGIVEAFATKVARINERLYARKLEKKGISLNPQTKVDPKKNGTSNDKGDPIEIDKVSNRKSQSLRKSHPQNQNLYRRKKFTLEQKQRFRDRVCLRYGEKGHFQSNPKCLEKKKPKTTAGAKVGRIRHAELEPLESNRNAYISLSQIACYNNSCLTYLSKK